ncbi:PepSY domain-containing protein [uncultured Microbulbifer sp.]|uniref:PepSY domain-containing protein n=1 Tax=uncultured Microbulbifer sp. TaxID=348147 RepID=UPI0026203C8B|nr:PepSY domain-containing protein [uncultured Microbulbifer sp.]
MKLPAIRTAVMLLVIGLCAALIASPLHAGQRDLRSEPVQRGPGHLNIKPLASIRVQNRGISRDQAASIVKKRYGGKILAISEVQRNGRAMYRVKGLSDKSQVYVVFVDKQSGRISR